MAKYVIISVPRDRDVTFDVVLFVWNTLSVKNAVTYSDVVDFAVSYPVAYTVLTFVWYTDVVTLDVRVSNSVALLVLNTVDEVIVVSRAVLFITEADVSNDVVVLYAVVVEVSNTVEVFLLVSIRVLNVI